MQKERPQYGPPTQVNGETSPIYFVAFSVYVGPQLFSTSTAEKPADSSASFSCSTVRGVS